MRRTRRQVIEYLTLSGAVAMTTTTAAAQSPSTGADVAIVLRGTSAPVMKAAADLAADITQVLGRAPTFVRAAPDDHRLVIEIQTTGRGDAETFSLSRRGNRIFLSGADMRGAIYAIYQFSQDYLGIDPMYYWTDTVPASRATIDMPDGITRAFPKPVIEYRGFFINDEDQLTGWAPATSQEKTNISPRVMDKVYETLLRLKANMVVPSTWPFPDDPQIKAASERGLIVNQHHATPVGMNAVRWPDGVPYNYTTHPEILRRAWRNAVDLYDRDQEILWTVGLRGLSDISYASMDSSVVGDKPRMGMLIERAIADQMAIVRQRFPNARFVTNLWSEGAELMRDGHLNIPEEVIIAWPDTGWGLIKDKGRVKAGQGFYFHVAMLNLMANQLSEMVPVSRIRSEFGRFIDAGATKFALVNVSDIRAVSMTAKATMDIAWGGVPTGDDKTYYHDWAEGAFGAPAASRVADFYMEYFDTLPRMPPGDDSADGNEYGDQHYQTVGRDLLLRAMIDPPYYKTIGQSAKWAPSRMVGVHDDDPQKWLDDTIARERAACGAAAPKWDRLLLKAKAILPLVNRDRRDYYRYAVLAMLAANRNGGAMLLAISRAVESARQGDAGTASRYVAQARAQIAEMQRYQAEGCYGKWKDWFRGDWFVDPDATSEWLTTFEKWLADPLKTTPVPVMQADWKGYYRILHYQGNRRVDVS